MSKFRRFAMVVLSAASVSACAGRAPAPVAVVQPQDHYMDCAAVIAEVQANNAKVQQLAADQGLKTTQNVAAGVAGIFIPVLWFGMDWQGTADKEIQALQARQQYLAVLAEQKHCGAEPEPAPAPQQRRAVRKQAAPAESPPS